MERAPGAKISFRFLLQKQHWSPLHPIQQNVCSFESVQLYFSLTNFVSLYLEILQAATPLRSCREPKILTILEVST